MQRVKFLDGFRGLAILLVIGFHAYARFTTIVPYGTKYTSTPIFSQGFLGVQLFFLISGFVILMTLEKSTSFSQFLYKRWIRLFPAMLIATIIVFSTGLYFSERPNGVPALKDAIPGLTFLDPVWINKLLDVNVASLENPFWTLYIEVKFYIIFGLLYFYSNAKKAVAGISGMFFIYCILKVMKTKIMPEYSWTIEMCESLGISSFGWFACGALSYFYFVEKKIIYLIMAVIIGIACISAYHNYVDSAWAASIVLIVFLSAIYFDKLKSVFASRFLVFFGFISYPLYLIHEGALISMIVKINRFTIIPDILLPIIPFFILTVIAYLITLYLEPFARAKITTFINFLKPNLAVK